MLTFSLVVKVICTLCACNPYYCIIQEHIIEIENEKV